MFRLNEIISLENEDSRTVHIALLRVNHCAAEIAVAVLHVCMRSIW